MNLPRRKAAERAAERERRLMAAIKERGRERGMSLGRVLAVQNAAWQEIRDRGLGAEQIMRGLPASPVECCGDCYDDLMGR